MENITLENILNLINPYIAKQNAEMRPCITAEECLAATLRFLAAGQSFKKIVTSETIILPPASPED